MENGMTVDAIAIFKVIQKLGKSVLFIVILALQQSLWATTHPTNDAEIREKLNANYSPAYTLSLEEAYGPGMTSEGGAQAIEKMFAGIVLRGKKMLDIGSGLGGVSLYLAEKHHAILSGVEINPWMIEESTKRIPGSLKSKMNYVLMGEGNSLPFLNASFDIVYSKGVLTHVPDKSKLVKEIFRVLKPNGIFVVDDWLSPVSGRWGAKLNKMAETEGLILFAQTEKDYIKLLKETGFKNIKMRSESENYSKYNREVASSLKIEDKRKQFQMKYGEKSLLEAIEGYQLIADSIDSKELLIRHFYAERP